MQQLRFILPAIGSLRSARSACLQLEIYLDGGPNVSSNTLVLNKWSYLMGFQFFYLGSLRSAPQID
jgi:hypothetical protein